MKLSDGGIVLMNQHPEMQSLHVMQPAIQVLSENEIICVQRCGDGMESVRSALVCMRSTDRGKAWAPSGEIVRTDRSPGPVYSYFCPHLAALRNGTLVVLSVRFRRDTIDRRCYNPSTGGCLPVETTLFSSDDSGRTWEGPRVIPLGGRYAYAGGPVLELHDGRWMVVFETWKPFDDSVPNKTRLFALFSSDGGVTWENETTVYEDPAGRTRFWDVTFTQLHGGTIVGVAWSHDTRTTKDLPHHRIVSEDAGETWRKPEPTNREGQFNVTRELRDGRLFGVYNMRGGQPGVYAALSEDQGLTWDLDHRVLVWDALGRSAIGKRSGDAFLDDLRTFAFGKPDASLAGEKDVVVAFWATESCITHTRWCRLTIDELGKR